MSVVQSAVSRRGNAFTRWVRDSKFVSVALDVLVGVGYASAGLLVPDFLAAGGVLLIAVVLHILHRLRGLRHDQAVSMLQNQLTGANGELDTVRESLRSVRAEIGRSVDAILHRLAIQFSMTARDRATLYVRSDDGLRVVGRFSQDTVYRTIGAATRSAHFGPTFGLAGLALRTGQRQQRRNGPDFAVDSAGYRHWHRERNFLTLERGSEPRMKSRCYDVIPIFDSGGHKEVIGVLAMESVQTRSAAITSVGDSIADESSAMAGTVREMLLLYATAVLGGQGDEVP